MSFLKQTAGEITVDGVDADYTIPGPGAVTVFKVGTALMVVGSNSSASVVVLDVA